MLSLSAIRAAILTATLCYGLPPPQDIFGRETMLEAGQSIFTRALERRDRELTADSWECPEAGA